MRGQPGDPGSPMIALFDQEKHILPTPGETLLLVDVQNAHGVVLLRCIWATTPDLCGHRRTLTCGC